MATTSVKFTVTATGGSGSVTNPDFSYASIATRSTTTVNDIDELVVSLNGAALTASTDYTVDEGDEEVTISATLAEGDVVLIERVTDIDTPAVSWTNNALIDKDNLNDADEQLLFKLQELENDTDNTITLDLTNDCWDLQGKRACNGSAATGSSDLATLGQVENLIQGAETAEIDNITQWDFTGDGSTTDFVLSSAPSGLTDENQLLVFVEGILQRRANYSLTVVGSTKTLVFSTAPVNTARIIVVTVQGIVSAILASDTVDGSSIVADSIGLAALNFGSGSAGRILIVDASGNPAVSVPVHTDISDFGVGVRQNRLDQMAAPTEDVGMNSNKITDLTAGAAGSTNACNVAQMEAYADTAATNAASAVNVSGTTVVVSSSTSLGVSGYERSNSTSKAKFVVVTADAGGVNDVNVQVKSSGGSYATIARIGKTGEKGSVSFFVPASGSYKIIGVSSNGTLEYLTEQSF